MGEPLHLMLLVCQAVRWLSQRGAVELCAKDHVFTRSVQDERCLVYQAVPVEADELPRASSRAGDACG